MTRKKLTEVYANGKMTAMIFKALNETDEPMTEKQLKERLGLKEVNVMRAVLNDLTSSSRGELVIFEEQEKTYSLTAFGKVLAKKMGKKKIK